MMVVAGVEAAGCWETEVQLLEASGGGSHQQSEVQVVGAAAVGAASGGGHQQRKVQAVEATRVQPGKGAASYVRVQPGKGATSVVGGA